MARERTITRTIVVYHYEVKVYDEDNDSLLTLSLTTIGDEDEKTRIKELESDVKLSGYAMVKVLSVNKTSELRKMTEKHFYFESVEA